MSRPIGKVAKFVDKDAVLRVAIVNATQVVQEMQQIQKTFPIPTMMVGRTMVAAALMASQLKEEELVSLYFRGSGPIEMVFAEATHEGAVRGYTGQAQLDLPLKDGRFDLHGAIGGGHLTVVRSNPWMTQPYRGTVAIQTGEIGDDVAFYLQQSQQIRSVVAVGVKLTQYGQVSSAGGLIIELLPGAKTDVEDKLEARVRTAGSISEAFEAGLSYEEIMAMYLADFKMEELPFESTLAYTCRCSKERLARSLELLPVAELDDILKQSEEVKAKCEFCGREYDMERSEVQVVRDKAYKNSLN